MTPLSGPDDPDKFPAPKPVSVFAPFAKIRSVGSRLPDDQNFTLFRFVGTRLADDENFICFSIITHPEITSGVLAQEKYQL